MIDLRTRKLWVNPENHAAKQATDWRVSNPEGAAIMDQIAAVPAATWLTGSSSGSWVDSMLDKVPATEIALFVAYNIPMRDLGSYSSGGALSASVYRSWVDGIATGIGARECMVILEPDALAQISRMTETGRMERYALLDYAVRTLAGAGALVYVDVGDSGWTKPADMALAAILAGVQGARGISSNVAHHRRLPDEDAYCAEVLAIIGNQDLRYVVDTSRCGKPPYDVRPGESSQLGWCNSPGAGYGARPNLRRSTKAFPLCDGAVWCKTILSDGSREGAPAAGQRYPEQAIRMFYAAVPRFVG